MVRRQIKALFAAFFACLMVVAAVNAAAEADFLGFWSGNWEGAGSEGRFDISITKSGDALGGGVDVGQDTGDYKAAFTTAALEGGKFKARYDYTPDPQAEIVLEGTFEGTGGTGTWTMVQKGGSEPFAAGSWAVKKK
jgi:opacity protein-like surface antigen